MRSTSTSSASRRYSTVLELFEEERDLIWYRNAAELLGLEEPSWANAIDAPGLARMLT
jgi:hypothetical protein